MHDNEGDGITVGNHLHVGVLGYADDTAMLSASADKMSERVTKKVVQGSKADADMVINAKKQRRYTWKNNQ